MRGTGRHFRLKGKNKLCRKVKCSPGELNICELYNRAGKAIGSSGIPTGNVLPHQKIRNRTGWIRKLVFPAGVSLQQEVDLRITDKCQTNVESRINNRIYSQEERYREKEKKNWGGEGMD